MLEYHDRTLFEGVEALTSQPETFVARMQDIMESLISAGLHMLARGVLHLDVKGDNVLFSAAGEPVFIDFGHCVKYATDDDAMIIPRGVIGNGGHRSPELKTSVTTRKGQEVSGDKQLVFSLGVLFAECLAPYNQHPFEDYNDGITPDDQALDRWRSSILMHLSAAPNVDKTEIGLLLQVVLDMIHPDASKRTTMRGAHAAVAKLQSNVLSRRGASVGTPIQDVPEFLVPHTPTKALVRGNTSTTSPVSVPALLPQRCLPRMDEPARQSPLRGVSIAHQPVPSRQPPPVVTIGRTQLPVTVEKHAVVEDEAARTLKVKYHFDLCKYEDIRPGQQAAVSSTIAGSDTVFVVRQSVCVVVRQRRNKGENTVWTGSTCALRVFTRLRYTLATTRGCTIRSTYLTYHRLWPIHLDL